jgi:hypothetical protein
MEHVHEFIWTVRAGRIVGWPVERCLGGLSDRKARELIARREATITPGGLVTNVTMWKRVEGAPVDGCRYAAK